MGLPAKRFDVRRRPRKDVIVVLCVLITSRDPFSRPLLGFLFLLFSPFFPSCCGYFLLALD